MAPHSDSRSIEADIERKRAELGSTLDELQDRFSVERLAEDALGTLRTNAASYARSIDHAVRANPLALTLTGVGLAWLIFGSRRGNGAHHEAFDHGEHGAAADAGYRSYGHDDEGDSGDGWADRIDDLRSRASDALRRIERRAKSGAGSVRDYTAERARILSDFTGDMSHALGEGLEGVTGAARDEVLHLRRQAYAARLKIGRKARRSGRELEQMVNDHPLVAGLVAMALGAALAAALPRTRTEDETFGEESDHLMASAARRLRDERDRLARVARGIGEDARASARDAREALGESAEEFVEHAKDRISSEAERMAQTGSDSEAKGTKAQSQRGSAAKPSSPTSSTDGGTSGPAGSA